MGLVMRVVALRDDKIEIPNQLGLAMDAIEMTAIRCRHDRHGKESVKSIEGFNDAIEDADPLVDQV